MKTFNTKDSVILIDGDREFTYYKNSGKYTVRFLPTGEPASFSLDELSQFLTLIKIELLKEVVI